MRKRALDCRESQDNDINGNTDNNNNFKNNYNNPDDNNNEKSTDNNGIYNNRIHHNNSSAEDNHQHRHSKKQRTMSSEQSNHHYREQELVKNDDHERLLQGYQELSLALDKVLKLRAETVDRPTSPDQRNHQSESTIDHVEKNVLDKCIMLAKSMGAHAMQPTDETFDDTYLLNWISRLSPSSSFSLVPASADTTMSSPRRRTSNIGRKKPLYLPQHIVMSIIQFLPVSSLISCFMVSKTFAQACSAKGAIQNALIFDRVKTWTDVIFNHFIRDMLRDDPNKFDTIDTVQFVPIDGSDGFNMEEVYEYDETSAPTIFPALQIVRQGEHQNTAIKDLAWRVNNDFSLDEDDIIFLHSTYPNLTSIDIDIEMYLPALFDIFPQLQKLSTVAIRDMDIIGRSELQPVQSLQKLSLAENMSDLTLHYICHMFPNLTELSILEVHSYDETAEITISEIPPVKKRLLRDLPVPPLKKLVIEGSVIEDEHIFEDFLFRLDQLESLRIDAMCPLGKPDDFTRLETIIRNNQSLTELFISNHIIGSAILDLFSDKNKLLKLDAKISTPRSIISLVNFKGLQYLHLQLQGYEYRGSSALKSAESRAIESLVELVDLSIPARLKIDFERLPKLRRLKLTDRIPIVSIKSSSLEMLDLSSSSIFFAIVACPNLRMFNPCHELIILQLDTPQLSTCPSYMDLSNVISLSIRSLSLTSITLSGCNSLESCNLVTPMLKELRVSWGVLHALLSKNNTQDAIHTISPSQMNPSVKNVRSLVIEDSESIVVDESLPHILSLFPLLEDICFTNCKFVSNTLYGEDSDTASGPIIPIPGVKRLKLFETLEFEPFAEIMAQMFPNVHQFSMRHWSSDSLPEDQIITCVTEKWEKLTDLSIETDTYPSSKFTKSGVERMLNDLLTKGVICRLDIVLPLQDDDFQRYALEIVHCSSLRELVTNVDIITPDKEEEEQNIAKMTNLRFIKLAYWNDWNHVNDEMSQGLASWLTETCPNLEALELVMLFPSTQQPHVFLLLDELVSRLPKLKAVQLYSSAVSPIREFSVLRERYPQLDFTIGEESQFENHRMSNPVDSEPDSDDFDDEEDEDDDMFDGYGTVFIGGGFDDYDDIYDEDEDESDWVDIDEHSDDDS